MLGSLSGDPMLMRYRDYILHLIEKRAEQLSESLPWKPQDIRDFMQEYGTAPHSAHELFKIACNRFTAIKDEVEGILAHATTSILMIRKIDYAVGWQDNFVCVQVAAIMFLKKEKST